MAKSYRHQAPAALHGSTKSGYTEQVMPTHADTGMGAVIPVGSVSGAQEGRIPPALRDYSKARYDVVTLEEAQERMIKRMKGKLPPIKGGLDDNSTQAPRTRTRKQAQARQVLVEDFDPLGPGDMQNFEPDARPADQYDAEEPLQGRVAIQRRTVPAYAEEADPAVAYLSKRVRVTLELTDTTLFVNAVDAIVSNMGVTLLLPTKGEGATFVPKAGSEVTITLTDGRGFKCYFPGVTFDVDALNLLGLVFIRAEEA